MQRAFLIIVLAVLGGIAVLSSAAAIVFGPVFGPDQGPVPVDVDSEFRFISASWLTAGCALWWSLGRLEARAGTTRVVLAAIVAGGAARLVSLAVVGRPMPLFLVALGVELVAVPVVAWWHTRFLRSAGPPPPSA